MASEALPSLQQGPAYPSHVAVIMDGNGRWAKSHRLPRIAGHQKGAEAVRALVKSCGELGIPYVTIYAFSSENWRRPASEVDELMGLLRLYLRREIAELHREGVRLRFIGDRLRLPGDISALIDSAEECTRGNRGVTLTVAVNYGSRSEIVAAAQRLAREVAQGRLRPDDITEELFGSQLSTADLPDPDLLIRTSGEQRLSNFLLWQSAYTELVFVPTLWPDFSRDHLLQAIGEFQRRERRYGGTSG